MTNMISADLISGVDHAAAMNDRWLFVASLVVFGVFAGFVMRYFVRQHEPDDSKCQFNPSWVLPSSGGKCARRAILCLCDCRWRANGCSASCIYVL